MGDKDDVKDDRKTAVGTGGAANVAAMVQVTPWTIGKPGKVTAVQKKDTMSLNAPDVRVTTHAQIANEALADDAPDIGEVEVGPVQNVISSSRVGTYTSLVEPGKVVATYNSKVGNVLDQASMADNPSGAWSAWQRKKPWYSPPTKLSKIQPGGEVTYFDKPGFDLPLAMAGGVLTSVTGSDAFSLSIAARQNGGALTYYESKNWTVPWDATFDPASHGRTDKEKDVDAPKRDHKDPKTFVKDPTVLDGPLALDSTDYFAFPTIEAAMAAGVDVLLGPRGLMAAKTMDPKSWDNMFHAIRTLNPNWVITIHCVKHKTFWNDDVTVRMHGHTQKSESFKIATGESKTVAVRFLEVFDASGWKMNDKFWFDFVAGDMDHKAVYCTNPADSDNNFTQPTQARWGAKGAGMASDYYKFSVTRSP